MEPQPVVNLGKGVQGVDRLGAEAAVEDFYPTEEMVEIQLPGGFHLATDQ